MAVGSETSQCKLFTLWILETNKKKSNKNSVFVQVLLKFLAKSKSLLMLSTFHQKPTFETIGLGFLTRSPTLSISLKHREKQIWATVKSWS